MPESTSRLRFTVRRHCVPSGPDGLSPLQRSILDDPAPVRVFSAPTGAGKSFALIKAVSAGRRCLFVVPTRRLAQNIAAAAVSDLASANPSMTPVEAASLVALWTSDETARLKAADPSVKVSLTRVRQARMMGPDVRFLVATPESVAALLAGNLGKGAGLNGFSIADVQQFDHVVFDEFHTIEARGFGLAATFAAVVANSGVSTKVTFLSATPIDVSKVLERTGTPSSSISVMAEQVVTTTSACSPDGTKLRALHGDVLFDFVDEDDMPALLLANADRVRVCLSGPVAERRQCVLIYDSLDSLLRDKARLASVFDGLGVPRDRRLAIDSVDDSRKSASVGDLFVVNASADPRDFDVLVATSSVEMGVTFKAGVILMDLGHGPMSFVQRAGRVARGDEPGVVVVRVPDRAISLNPWFRRCVVGWAAKLDAGGAIGVDDFLAVVRRSVADGFSNLEEADAEEPPAHFQVMAASAVWNAALFWHLLERGQVRRGERSAVREFSMRKSAFVAMALRDVAKPRVGSETTGKAWVEAFLAQASLLRSFAPTMRVVEMPARRSQIVPMSMIESRPELAGGLVRTALDGTLELVISRPLEDVLAASDREFVEARVDVLMLDGSTRCFPRRDAVGEVLKDFDDQLRRSQDPSTKARLVAARRLVRLSRLVPEVKPLSPSSASTVW